MYSVVHVVQCVRYEGSLMDAAVRTSHLDATGQSSSGTDGLWYEWSPECTYRLSQTLPARAPPCHKFLVAMSR